MNKNERDKYVFVGTDYFLSSKTTAFTYLKLNNKVGSLERKYITECQHEEFKNNNNILYLDQNVFNHLIETKVFETKDAVENFKTFFDDYMGKLDDGSIEPNGK